MVVFLLVLMFLLYSGYVVLSYGKSTKDFFF